MKSMTIGILVLFCFASGLASAGPMDISYEQSSLIPKRETGVLELLKKHPEYDGRGTIIAILDSGVDPAAAGMQVTSTGERKLVDVIDASGSGDVDMSREVKPDKDGALAGLTGRKLILPRDLKNPGGVYRIGIKRGSDLFYSTVMSRIKTDRKQAWERKHNEIKTRALREMRLAEKAGKRKAFKKARDDRNREERDLVAREELLESLRKNFAGNDPGPVYDCVVWHDGEHYRVLVDTDEDGDLQDEKILRPFGIDGEYADFGDVAAINFAVQVYDEGRLLSIVTVSGSHGSHVASIAAAHFPDRPEQNGVAPGARILSIRIGDLRTGGSSNMAGEQKAVAACAQYQVDVMNASWGGASSREDGEDLGSRLYNMLSEVYGVTVFVSAGNNGPALSTLGSPGGLASRIIGVGAYISSDMGKVLHAGTGTPPETMYQFASRGPAKNGDLGVDLVAPGGAVASYSFDTLQQSRSAAGSSMASPSLTGLGAILIGAARAEKLDPGPARLRAALMNTATRVEEIDVFAQGAGLPRALPALEHLLKYREERALDLFYEVTTHNNTFRSGPGLYLRQALPQRDLAPYFKISPAFPHSASNADKFDFTADIVFRSTVPWIEVPEYARMTSGSLDLRPVITLPGHDPRKGSAPLFGEIEAVLAAQPEAGPLFRIPVTVIRPEETRDEDGHRKTFSFKLEPGKISRRFFLAPPNSNRAWLTLKRTDKGEVPRRIKVQTITLTAVSSHRSLDLLKYDTYDAGEEETYFIPTEPGKTLEIALLQPWYTESKTSWEAEVRFAGFRSGDNFILLHQNERYAPMSIVSQAGVAVKPEAYIEKAVYVAMPDKTEFLPLSERGRFPPRPREEEPFTPVFLRQRFVVQMDKAFKIKFEQDRRYNPESLSSGLLHVFHESGERLYVGASYRSPTVTLPKGKTTIYRDIRCPNRSELEREENRALVYSHTLPSKKSVLVYGNPRSTLLGKTTSEFRFRANRHVWANFGDKHLSSLNNFKPAPAYFRGEMKLKSDSKWIHFTAPIEYHPGVDFKSVANKAPTPVSKETKKTGLQVYADDLYKRKLQLIKSMRSASKEEERTRRDDVLATLLEERPQDPDLLIEQAMIRAAGFGLLSDWHAPRVKDAALPKQGKKKKKAIRSVLNPLKRARALSNPRVTAEYFGARESTTDEELDVKKKALVEERKKNADRSRLARIALLKADIQHHLGNETAARQALKEVGRWEEKASTNRGKLETALLMEKELYGSALVKLNTRIKSAPYDRKLLQKRIELYEKLGWAEFARQERLRLKMREDKTPVAY